VPVPLIMFDIDHFKTINDRRGHDIGDAVLRQVAEAARAALAGDGRLGRIGGEGFLAVLTRGGEAEARTIGERLRAAVEALRIDDGDERLRVTISLGATLARPGNDRVEDALKRADLALYRAKEAGRNRFDWQPGPAADASSTV
jgi:diguanylate cyclase (GGDEF)-like protein